MNLLTHSLTVGYPGKVLLSDLDLELKGGEVTVLLGANGGGKSSLIRTLAALQQPLSGSVTVDGEPIASLSRRRLARTVAVVTGTHEQGGALTVGELVALGRQPYTGFFGRLGAADKAIVSEAMAAVGVEHLEHRHLATLSDGERRRAVIAKAFAQQTPVLLLDEPTAWLDVANRLDLLALLRRIAHDSGRAVLVSSHDISASLDVADRLWLMTAATLPDGHATIAEGTPAELIAQGRMNQLFPGRNVVFDPQLRDFKSR